MNREADESEFCFLPNTREWITPPPFPETDISEIYDDQLHLTVILKNGKTWYYDCFDNLSPNVPIDPHEDLFKE